GWGRTPPGTVFASDVLDLLLAAGLPEPEAAFWVTISGRRYRIDLASRDPRSPSSGWGRSGTRTTWRSTGGSRSRSLGFAGWRGRRPSSPTWRRPWRVGAGPEPEPQWRGWRLACAAAVICRPRPGSARPAAGRSSPSSGR